MGGMLDTYILGMPAGAVILSALLALAIIGWGVWATIVSLMSLIRHFHLVLHGVRAKARISSIDVTTERDDDGKLHKTYLYSLSYTDEAGGHHVLSPYGRYRNRQPSLPGRRNVGDEVTVYYSPRNPDEATVGNLATPLVYLMAAMVSALAVAVVLFVILQAV